MFYALRHSLGHALIVLGTILGLLAILGYGILRNEGYVATGILVFGTLQLICGMLLLALENRRQQIKLISVVVVCISFLALLVQSLWYLAGATTESTALQLLACFITGLSVFTVLNDMMHENSAIHEDEE
ncbi:MAG: hypothetical protein AAF267_00520 [Deinococcota bacterium]